jgi:hypothetical protein
VPRLVVTVTLALPATAIIAAVTGAVSVPLEYAVLSAVPFQFTVEPVAKLFPLTVRVKAEPPAVAEVGLRPVIVGDACWGFHVPTTALEGPAYVKSSAER